MDNIHARIAVIGGGPAGVCGALAAARSGLETVLIQNRPVLGGNSSSEIRVWSRGAVGAGNFFSEEMGIWGELKLTNLYRNLDGNPIFWDDVLLDAVLAEPKLTVLFNTEISELKKEKNRILSVSGIQQGTERHFLVEADVFLDATGDASLGYLAGLPYYLGDAYIPSASAPLPEKLELLGCSILFFTRQEDHPVSFKAPGYAYSMEEIAGLINHGGRVVNEKMGGSDCWWFEFGGSLDTIGQLQDISMELKRLVMGVWNYIKNSGLYGAENYTLEWVGNIPGKRESRRMETAYILTEQDVRMHREFPDGAFYGGWYMDIHPSDGIHGSDQENCVQVPVNVYQVPLRCLYHPGISNLLFAGRNIGTQRGAFVSSRIMNTCALAGQAAGVLAEAMVRSGKAPDEMTEEDIRGIQLALLRGDMFIPGLSLADPENLAPLARAVASSFHEGACRREAGLLPIVDGAFVTFPGAGGSVELAVQAEAEACLHGQWFFSNLPNRFCPGGPGEVIAIPVQPGRQAVSLEVPQAGKGRFCTLVFSECKGVSVVCAEKGREGFLCGSRNSPVYFEPMLAYQGDAGFYRPERVLEAPNRPWNAPNQWRAAPGDEEPWLELRWDTPQKIHEIQLYLDPSLNEELPSSRAKYWQESHHFVPRTSMPASLLRSFILKGQAADGSWLELGRVRENFQRLVAIPVEGSPFQVLRLEKAETWGGLAAVYQISAY